ATTAATAPVTKYETGSERPLRINAADTASSNSTSAGIRITAPAPIIAAPRAASLAFSDNSARASSNSLPISLASCPTASLNSSGIPRLPCEFIAIPHVMRPVVSGRRIVARARRLRARRLGTIGRALQEGADAETGQHREAQKRRRLAPRKGLGSLHEVVEIPRPELVGHVLD